MVQRVPYADPAKVKALPAEAKAALGFAKNTMPKQLYKEMEYAFVEVANKKNNPEAEDEEISRPVATEKMGYAGKLDYNGASFMGDIGAYNPDDIPISVYEKMSKDPTIALALAVIRYTPASMNWRIDCDDEIQQKIITRILKPIYRKTVLGLTDGVRLGTAIAEKCWEYGPLAISVKGVEGESRKIIFKDDVWKYEKIKFVNPGSIRIKVDKKGNFEGVVQQDSMKGTTISVKKKKIVLYSHNVEFGNWFGESRLKYAYPAWYWSMVLTQFALKYYERRAIPLMKMKAPTGTSTINGAKIDNLTYALKIGQAATSNSVVVLPADFDKNSNKEKWDMEMMKDEQRGDMFIQILNFMDSRKLRGCFVPDKLGLASDGSTHAASGASAGDTLDVFIMIAQALANDLEEVFDTQIIPDIQRNNFIPSDIVEASLKIEKLDYTRKLLMKDVLLRMIMTAAGTMRDGRKAKFLPDMKKIAEMLDLPMDLFENMFDEYEVPVATGPDSEGDNPIGKKKSQDANNKNRGTVRKERTTKDRSAKEKKS